MTYFIWSLLYVAECNLRSEVRRLRLVGGDDNTPVGEDELTSPFRRDLKIVGEDELTSPFRRDLSNRVTAYDGNRVTAYDVHALLESLREDEVSSFGRALDSSESFYTLVKQGVECKSRDKELGKNLTEQQCAEACLQKHGCHFFVFGINNKAGKCYDEWTESENCSEKFEVDDFNFYKLNKRKKGEPIMPKTIKFTKKLDDGTEKDIELDDKKHREICNAVTSWTCPKNFCYWEGYFFGKCRVKGVDKFCPKLYPLACKSEPRCEYEILRSGCRPQGANVGDKIRDTLEILPWDNLKTIISFVGTLSGFPFLGPVCNAAVSLGGHVNDMMHGIKGMSDIESVQHIVADMINLKSSVSTAITGFEGEFSEDSPIASILAEFSEIAETTTSVDFNDLGSIKSVLSSYQKVMKKTTNLLTEEAGTSEISKQLGELASVITSASDIIDEPLKILDALV